MFALIKMCLGVTEFVLKGYTYCLNCYTWRNWSTFSQSYNIRWTGFDTKYWPEIHQMNFIHLFPPVRPSAQCGTSIYKYGSHQTIKWINSEARWYGFKIICLFKNWEDTSTGFITEVLVIICELKGAAGRWYQYFPVKIILYQTRIKSIIITYAIFMTLWLM